MDNATLDYSVVGFIDILGFSAMVDSDSKGGEAKYLPIFLDVFQELAGGMPGGGPAVKMFSDSIIVSANLNPANIVSVIKTSSDLQRLFLKKKILVRGGVAFGKHFSNDNVTFSQALVAAYMLESKVARFPRVVIDDSVLNFAWHHGDANDQLRDELKKIVVSDRDGMFFVDYLTEDALVELTPHVRACIESNMSPQETILEKMRWLLDYHNYSAGLHDHQPLNVQNFGGGFSRLDIVN